MIDPYLKTSMPVYDSIDRQNHRDECCKNEQFKLYTDRNHLPPFQIFIPNYEVDIPLAKVSRVWDIHAFNADTDEIATGGGFGYNNQLWGRLNYYNDGINTWVIYDGIALVLASPVGRYYLRFRFRFCDREDMYFWTEVFTVCDCELIPGVYSDELLVDGIFAFWNGNPTFWAIAETPPNNEITEVHRNAGHGAAPNIGNIIEGWNDTISNYNVFTSVGTQITDCQKTAAAGADVAINGIAGGPETFGFAVCEGEVINIQCNVNHVSGTLPYIFLNEGETVAGTLPGLSCSNAVRLNAGANNINLIATRSIPSGDDPLGVYVTILSLDTELVRFNTTGAVLVTGFGSCNWYSNAGAAVYIRQDVMKLYHLYEFNGDITNVITNLIKTIWGDGGTQVNLALGANTIVQIADGADGNLYISRTTACDVTGDNFSLKEVETWTMCNHLSLTWWSECDFDGIIYQFGYRNRLILEATLASPRAEIEKLSKKRNNQLFYEWISHKEFYGIKLLLSKYAFYALSRLPLYADNEFGHVILTLPNGDWAEIYEMTIDATWQTNNCYAEFSLDFIQGELIITNCCVDYDVSEQILE